MPNLQIYGAPNIYTFSALASFGSFATLNHINTRGAYIFQAPRAGTIESVGFLQSAGSAGTFTTRISLQDLDGSGHPDGTADEFRTGVGDTSAGWKNSGIISSDGTDTGTKRTVTQGQYLAVVFDFTAYTSGSWVISRYIRTLAIGGFSVYGDTRNSSGVWSKATNAGAPIALHYTDGVETLLWEQVGVSGGNTAFGINTTPDEVGLRFVPSVDLTLSGLFVLGALSGSFDLVVYTGAGTTLGTTTFSNQNQPSTGGWNVLLLTADIDLTAGSTYRIAIRPSTTTSDVIQHVDVDANGDLDAFPGGKEWYHTQRTDAGSWTDTNTRRPLCGLVTRVIGASGGPSGGVIGARIFTGF